MKYFIGLLFALTFTPSLALPTHAQSVVDESGYIKAYKRMGWTKTEFNKRSIALKDILSGGPSKDGIPPIDNPIFKPIAEVKEIAAREPVVGFSINGDARAYPLRVLTWHEIVNDNVGGKPVTITYCPLCNAAIVFDRTLDGKVLDFGTTGLLRNSDLVMYDRQTESWWQQFTGTSIVGSMMGKQLKVLPARLESYANFKKRFPKGKVLVPNNNGMRDYGRNPYANYDSAVRPFLYSGSMPKGIKPMERVVAFKVNGEIKVYGLPLLAKKGKISQDTFTIEWKAGQASALDTSIISKGRDVGNIIVQAKNGGKWEDIAYDVTFAFVVHAFYPKAKFIH